MNGDLSIRSRRVGVVVWCSFLTACGATTVLFAFFDPEALFEAAPWWWAGRRTVYALGFFFVWVIAACSATLAIYMAQTERASER